MPRLALLAAACVALALPAAAVAQVAAPAPRSAFDATTLDLSGDGLARSAPDMATVTLGVTASAPTAAQASQVEAQRMTATIAALKARGLAAKDIQTSGLSLNASYEFPQNQPRRLVGYEASNRVTVTVRDLARTGAVIDGAVAAGANTIEGVAFGLADPKPMQAEARLQAVSDLQKKAQLYASAAGMRIVRLVNLTEGGGGSPPPVPKFKAARGMMAAPASTPVEAGELEVRATVSATYELAPR